MLKKHMIKTLVQSTTLRSTLLNPSWRSDCWCDVDPPVFMEDLEGANFVLRRYGQEARVCLLACPNGKFRLGAERIIVAEYDMSFIPLYICQVARFKPRASESCSNKVLPKFFTCLPYSNRTSRQLSSE